MLLGVKAVIKEKVRLNTRHVIKCDTVGKQKKKNFVTKCEKHVQDM